MSRAPIARADTRAGSISTALQEPPVRERAGAVSPYPRGWVQAAFLPAPGSPPPSGRGRHPYLRDLRADPPARGRTEGRCLLRVRHPRDRPCPHAPRPGWELPQGRTGPPTRRRQHTPGHYKYGGDGEPGEQSSRLTTPTRSRDIVLAQTREPAWPDIVIVDVLPFRKRVQVKQPRVPSPIPAGHQAS